MGFTLIEILMVLAIAGLLAGIALPRLTGLYASIETASQRKLVHGQIEGLGYRAYASGQPIVLGSSTAGSQDTYPLDLPPGWRIELPQPLRYSARGVCSGGHLFIHDPAGGQESFHLVPPLCRIEAAEGSGT